MVIFNSKLFVYQRVTPLETQKTKLGISFEPQQPEVTENHTQSWDSNPRVGTQVLERNIQPQESSKLQWKSAPGEIPWRRRRRWQWKKRKKSFADGKRCLRDAHKSSGIMKHGNRQSPGFQDDFPYWNWDCPDSDGYDYRRTSIYPTDWSIKLRLGLRVLSR